MYSYGCFPPGRKLGFAIDNGKIHNVSLGQGQEIVAENALDVAAVQGHWVILQVLEAPLHWAVSGVSVWFISYP